MEVLQRGALREVLRRCGIRPGQANQANRFVAWKQLLSDQETEAQDHRGQVCLGKAVPATDILKLKC